MVPNWSVSLQRLILSCATLVAIGSVEVSQAQSPTNETLPLTQRFSELEKLKKQTSLFSDVTRDDWAYQPITELMQKYGCISGYPDGTFRGQQALTRNEFAAGLESCMNRMDKIIQDRTANLVTREDLATLFRVLSTIFENVPIPPGSTPRSPSTPAPNQTLPSPNSMPKVTPE